ncbi:MAG: hypothetical protein LLF92_08730 [Planctomycetaceae bacterium]|nr:hypothetical protein [Planctomycetaceae bacterium]
MLQDNNNHAVEDKIFSRKKSLMTVQQYASSQGISTGVVDECAKLGVVQVRKHKNKMFIVDLPLDANKNARRQEDDKPVEQINTIEQAQKITDMVNKIFQPSRQISKPAAAAKPVLSKPESISKPSAAIPDLKLFAQEEKEAPTVKFEKFEPAPQFKVSSMRKISDAFKVAAGSRVLLGILSIGIIASLCVYSLTSYQNQIQQKKLQRAYASITQLINEYDNANRKVKLYELDTANWRAEAQRSKKSIASLEVELVQTKERLSQTQDDLATTQQNHVDTLKKLNEQIQAITTKIKSSKKEN